MREQSNAYLIQAMMAEFFIAWGMRAALWCCPKGYQTSLDKYVVEQQKKNLRDYTNAEIGAEYLRRLQDSLGDPRKCVVVPIKPTAHNKAPL